MKYQEERTNNQRDKRLNIKKQRKKADVVEGSKKGIRNKETNIISFVFVALFFLLSSYLVYFNVYRSKDVADNSYNRRIDSLEEKIIRGSILASDGTVLAETETDDDGSAVGRYYPFGKMYSHIVGMNMTKSGIEGLANYELLSADEDVINQLASDMKGKKLNGNNVITTLDPALQESAYNALGNNKGAVVVMEPSTGKILAMVSKPDYDPNDAPEYYDDWLNYSTSDSVLLNRATQGLYPPGSTFKMLTLLEYIRDNKNYKNYKYDCTGTAYVDRGTTIPCYNGNAHGEETLKQAFANSCNCAFSTIGFSLDLKKFRNMCEDFLFNTNLDIGIASSQSSFELNEKSGVSDIQETCIGQGRTMISPVHNLMIVSAFANDGKIMKPYFIDSVVNDKGKTVSSTQPEVRATVCSAQEAAILREYMRAVVTQGTGTAFRNCSYEAAGKTGTAQYNGGDHSWFVGLAPYDNPEVSISVVLEGGYSGVPSAQFVAKKVLDTYFAE